ncbi:hypothetical protein [Thalassobacillus sp. CUG 92003]|uniref:hypothetical protein n=1 Tax=Thalassobacillus sp. CUG 92003 TaxID=2736641 RepID=UPI0015E6D79A|nr:hypothetical protein [Thalassobacillus sp. CUG 92003]
MKYVSGLLIGIVVLLSACSGNNSTLKLDDKRFADTLFIQKVENGSPSEEKSKIVSDKDKIEKILTMVEGLNVEKTDNVLEKLKGEGNVYMLGFFEGKATPSKKGEYAFNLMENGTILFGLNTYDNQDSASITTEKHPELTKEIKQVLEIEF